MPKLRTLLLAALGTLAAITPASAQYPEKQITMVVCFPAGGGTDIAARLVNVPLGEALGKPIVIENRGGAGGNIGIAAVKRLPADGYTLLVCSSAFVVNPSLYAQAAYDPLKDFIPLMVMGASPNVFVVPAQSEIKSMKEFIDKAKANPGKMNWTRSDTFQGVYVLAGTPQPIVDRLAKELATILAKPDVQEKFAKIGLPVVAEGPAEFRKRVEREVPMFKEIIDKAGLKIP
jgi:tripartite-type tricarboxylate transporter receptor subunit TctC